MLEYLISEGRVGPDGRVTRWEMIVTALVKASFPKPTCIQITWWMRLIKKSHWRARSRVANIECYTSITADCTQKTWRPLSLRKTSVVTKLTISSCHADQCNLLSILWWYCGKLTTPTRLADSCHCSILFRILSCPPQTSNWLTKPQIYIHHRI